MTSRAPEKPSLYHIQSITHRRAPGLCQFWQCVVSSWLWRLALKSEEHFSSLAHGRSWTGHNFITIDKLHYNVLMCRPCFQGIWVKCLKHGDSLRKLFGMPRILQCVRWDVYLQVSTQVKGTVGEVWQSAKGPYANDSAGERGRGWISYLI